MERVLDVVDEAELVEPPYDEVSIYASYREKDPVNIDYTVGGPVYIDIDELS